MAERILSRGLRLIADRSVNHTSLLQFDEWFILDRDPLIPLPPSPVGAGSFGFEIGRRTNGGVDAWKLQKVYINLFVTVLFLLYL